MAYETTGVLSAVLPVLLAAGFVNSTATFTPGPAPSTVKMPSGETVDVETALKQLVQAAGAANAVVSARPIAEFSCRAHLVFLCSRTL
jgi:outer membrane PBP1 activator LpoA protein